MIELEQKASHQSLSEQTENMGQKRSHPVISASTFPPLYRSWIEQVLAGSLPVESLADCRNCSMSKTQIQNTSESVELITFSPKTKCCTFNPTLPNFLVGRILEDNDPKAMPAIEKRLEERNCVTPLEIFAGPAYALLYERTYGKNFGQSLELLCPHYLEDEGICSIWKHRESVCATWFCRHVRGAVGWRFWQAVKRFISEIETSLACWCVLELDIGTEALQELFPEKKIQISDDNMSKDKDKDKDKEQEIIDQAYQKRWGHWLGREREFFKRCASLVNALTWDDVKSICGPDVHVYLRLMQKAYQEHMSDNVPSALRLDIDKVHQFDSDYCMLSAYSPYCSIFVGNKTVEMLSYFNGRTTIDALRILYDDKGLKFHDIFFRQMIDYEILVSAVTK